jgi:hypothetical protein
LYVNTQNVIINDKDCWVERKCRLVSLRLYQVNTLYVLKKESVSVDTSSHQVSSWSTGRRRIVFTSNGKHGEVPNIVRKNQVPLTGERNGLNFEAESSSSSGSSGLNSDCVHMNGDYQSVYTEVMYSCGNLNYVWSVTKKCQIFIFIFPTLNYRIVEHQLCTFKNL